MLKDAIETSQRIIDSCVDFETQGNVNKFTIFIIFEFKHKLSKLLYYAGLECAEKIKTEFDTRWSPHWHVVIGRNFGSFVTHETKNFLFFYLGDKAVMIFKAG